MCYSQGDGFNTSLSRLGHCSCDVPTVNVCFVVVYKIQCVCCVLLCSVVRPCANQDDVNRDYVCVHIGVGAADVEVDVIYISFVMSAQYTGYLVPYKDKEQPGKCTQ